MPTYVVGVDGSPASLGALGWTQQLAKRTGAVVKAVVVWVIPPADGTAGPQAIEMLKSAAQNALDRSLSEVPANGSSRTGETILHASVAWGLIDSAAEADLLVVGARPHSKFERVVGSVAVQCAQHAKCPFLAVPESSPPPGDLVAVAYDGSDSAEAALKWAASITTGSDMKLRVLAVSEEAAQTIDPGSRDDRAVEELRETVTRVVPDIGDDVEYQPIYGQGKVTTHLVEGAEGASLLAVGSRGRGGFTGLLLGSVSQRCLESSPIPVAVIRD
ncbi:MAG: universal stress protein [Acidimicrobiales bacterium]